MKIRSVKANNRKKQFEVETRKGTLVFPYAKLDTVPTPSDRIAELYVDPELAREGFTYMLASGKEDSVHIDHVLEYNQDPDFMADLLLYKLTLEAERRLEKSRLGVRSLARRLSTSPAQIYRLLDPTNYKKSVKQMLALLYVLDCEVDFVVRERRAS